MKCDDKAIFNIYFFIIVIVESPPLLPLNPPLILYRWDMSLNPPLYVTGALSHCHLHLVKYVSSNRAHKERTQSKRMFPISVKALSNQKTFTVVVLFQSSVICDSCRLLWLMLSDGKHLGSLHNNNWKSATHSSDSHVHHVFRSFLFAFDSGFRGCHRSVILLLGYYCGFIEWKIRKWRRRFHFRKRFVLPTNINSMQEEWMWNFADNNDL